MPKVSIIVPLYNEEKYISRCIESILQSTYKDFEIILLDDDSCDNSFRICEGYAKKNNNISVYRLNRGGVSRARNYGLDKATGEYIWFVDGDDKVYPESLEYLVKGIEENNCELVIGKYKSNRVDAQSDRIGVCSVEDYAGDFCIGSGFYYNVLWNKLYRRDIIKQNYIQFSEHISFAEDSSFNCDYLLYCKKVNYIDKVVYYYSDENSYNKSVTMSLEKETSIICAFKEILKKKRKLIEKYNLKEKVKHEVNNIFFNSIYQECKLMKQYKFDKLLLDTWNSEEFVSVVKSDSGVKGKKVKAIRFLKSLDAFWLYKLVVK